MSREGKKINLPRKKVIGLDLGATTLKGAVVDFLGRLGSRMEIKTRAERGKERIINDLVEITSQLREKEKGVLGLGLGIASPVDFQKGWVINPPNLPGWGKVPLVKILKEKITLPLVLDNDANCALIGEAWQGKARGYQNVILLTLGSGVGGAIMIEGQLYRGKRGLAGEIGHLIIDSSSDYRCGAGHSGCLEALIGGRSLEKRLGKDFKELTFLASQGDPWARKEIRKFKKIFNLAIENLERIFDPQLIVISGRMAKKADLFLQENSLLQVSKLIDQGGILGAAKLALEAL